MRALYLFFLLFTSQLVFAQKDIELTTDFFHNKIFYPPTLNNLKYILFHDESIFNMMMEDISVGPREYNEGAVEYNLNLDYYNRRGISSGTYAEVNYSYSANRHEVTFSSIQSGNGRVFLLDDLINSLRNYYTFTQEDGSEVYKIPSNDKKTELLFVVLRSSYMEQGVKFHYEGVLASLQIVR